MGLLKALYDAIGSSIKIPNNGTKTLKLRLSVGQEPAAVTVEQGQAMASKTEKLDNIKEEKLTKNTPKKKDNVKVKDNSNVKLKDKHKETCKVKDISRLNNLVGSTTKGTPKCNNETQAASQSAAAAAKTRLGSHKHKELVSLVQENMERNHIKPLRYNTVVWLLTCWAETSIYPFG